MGAGGFISNMQSSLKNNNRRKGRERFKERNSAEQKQTKYNVPKVSEEERNSIVSSVTRRRKSNERIALILISFLAAGITACFIWWLY